MTEKVRNTTAIKPENTSVFSEKTGNAYIIPSDFPDPDIIRVDDTYYLISTTMHLTPGAVILRSHNLLDWEFCSYVFDELDGTDGQKLSDNKGIYGRGMWAACIRHHADKFWVSFVANDTHKSYLFTADEITGPWERHPIEGFYHDMSVLFDDDGKSWIVHGNRELYLTEMKADLSGPLPGGFNDVIIREPDGHEGLGHEGSHIYKIDGKYYIFTIDWPRGKPRTENCFTADRITGPWEGAPVLSSEFGGWQSGTAQGGIVDTPDGRWYSVVFQDHGALGRIPVLVSVRFEDHRPIFGEPPAPPALNASDAAPAYKAASAFKAWDPGRSPAPLVTVPDLRPGYKYAPLWGNSFTAPAALNADKASSDKKASDTFKASSADKAMSADKAPDAFKATSADKASDAFKASSADKATSTDKASDAFKAAGPAPYWQWNHIHDPKLVSLTERTLSITTDKLVKNPVQAANTLTQRTWGLSCAGSISLSAADLNDGDVAGLMALEGEYAFIGIMKQYGRYKLVTARHQIRYEPWAMGVHDEEGPTFITQKQLSGPEADLRLVFSLEEENEHVQMFFREGGWRELGKSAPLRFTLDQFVGVRFALFAYSTEKVGGTAHFSDFDMQILKQL